MCMHLDSFTQTNMACVPCLNMKWIMLQLLSVNRTFTKECNYEILKIGANNNHNQMLKTLAIMFHLIYFHFCIHTPSMFLASIHTHPHPFFWLDVEK
jgi:hypothetical protein